MQPREEQILAFCQTARSRAEIQDLFGLKDAKHFREKYLAPLLSRGVLRLTDPANLTARSQKYQTTKIGKTRMQPQATLFDNAKAEND